LRRMISGSAGILCSCLVLAGLPTLASASCCSNRLMKSRQMRRLRRFFACPSQLQVGSRGRPTPFLPASVPTLGRRATRGRTADDPAGAPGATSLERCYRYLSCHPGDHHSTISESSGATSRTTFVGRPRRRRGRSLGKGGGVAALTAVVCRSRCSAVCAATNASSRSHLPRAQRTFASELLLRRSECFLDLQSLCADSLRHLISCKTLMPELCLEVVDGVARVRQPPLNLLARSGLLAQRLPYGVQLLEAGAAVTMNHSDGTSPSRAN
jgi:hypothetical protein